MNQIDQLLKHVLAAAGLVDMVISGARSGAPFLRIKLRPVEIKGVLYFQLACYTDKQVFHENLTMEAARERRVPLMMSAYRQTQIRMRDRDITVLVSKKGKVMIKARETAREQGGDLSHNRRRHYILEEGKPVPFMQDLGIMTAEGKIVRAKYDKYRQINRFLEFIRDVLPEFEKGRRLRIIDFGCGKSYLTFAMYYYLKELEGYDLAVTGLDLKEKVIDDCQRLAERYGYDGLHFQCGDIADYDGLHFQCGDADYEGAEQVDMVVTLHACDTATDYALYKAIRWKARVILSVPCCQHELNQRMHCDTLAGAFQYGIIKERTAALMTDAMRGQLLELSGYKTQLLEFIEMEHTPKNILIRAVRSDKLQPPAVRRQRRQQYEACRDLFGPALTLERLLTEGEAPSHE